MRARPNPFVPYPADWCDGADDAWTLARRDDVERVFTRLWQETCATFGEPTARRLHIADVARFLRAHAAE